MSVYGNAIMLGGGGLKTTDAILRVIAPALSTVTITKGSVSKSDAGHENALDHTLYDYYFIIHASQFDSTPWTVTATLGSDSATAQVVINTADEYDVSLSYILWLYNLGDQCTSVTGGWRKVSSGTLSLGAEEMTFVSGSGTKYWAATTNQIDLTGYSYLTFSAWCGSSYQQDLGIASTAGGTTAASTLTTASASSYEDYDIDISAYSGLYYVQFANRVTNQVTHVNKVYLHN